MQQPNSSSGACAIVTGGASGIGKELCIQIAQQGGAVAVLDVNEGPAAAVASSIVAAGGKALAIGCDISRPEQVQNAVARILEELGRPQALFNVAAIVKFARVEDTDFDTFQRILSVNLTGAFLMSKTVLPHLVAARGSIVNISSMAGHLGLPYLAAYCASKGGLIALTKAMAKEFTDRGVRINVIAPGGVDTPMGGQALPADAPAEVLRLIPLSPIGRATPQDIARLALFAASSGSGNLSGALIPVDGAST